MNATAPQAIMPEHLRQRVELLLQRRAGARRPRSASSRSDPSAVCMPVAVTTIDAGAARHRRVLEQHVRAVAERDVGPASDAGVLARSARSRRSAPPPASRASPSGRCARRRGRCRPPRPGRRRRARSRPPARARRAPSRTTFACGTCRLRQRVDARPRLQLLPRAEHDVEQDQQRDDDAGRDLADREAHHRDRDQHDVHRVAQLARARPPTPTAASPWPISFGP